MYWVQNKMGLSTLASC